MTITRNLIDGASLTESATGYALTVVYVLENVSGNGDQQQFNALQDARVPRIGDGHPVIPGIQVTERSAEPVDDTVMRVTVQYGVADAADTPAYELGQASGPQGTISISSAVVTEQTQFDVGGRPLKVSYTGKLTDDEGNPVEVKGEEQVATVEIQRPETIITFTRRERGSPLFFATDAVGSVNVTDIGRFRAGTLLLTRIEADSDDNGITFTVVYEFQYRPVGWTVTVVFVDPQTDRPPVDVERNGLGSSLTGVANGVAGYEVYPTYDFGAFRLPF
jgi:hypothetical protein